MICSKTRPGHINMFFTAPCFDLHVWPWLTGFQLFQSELLIDPLSPVFLSHHHCCTSIHVWTDPDVNMLHLCHIDPTKKTDQRRVATWPPTNSDRDTTRRVNTQRPAREGKKRKSTHTSMTSIESAPFERDTNSQWARTKPAFQVHLDWCNKIDTWSRLNSGAPVT